MNIRWAFCVFYVACSFLPSVTLAIIQDESPASLSGFESSQLYAVEDGVQLNPSESLLTQLVFHTRSVSKESLEKYANFSTQVSDQNLTENPQASRFWVFQRNAVVTKIARQKLPDELATDELSEFWLLIANDQDQTYAIISRTIPAKWVRMGELAEPIEFTGFFYGLKTLAPYVSSELNVPLFVCERVCWFPNRENSDVGLEASQLFLASEKVDLTYLDLVTANQKRRMYPEESDYFYQMLSAATRAQNDLSRVADLKTITFLDLIQDPNKHLGSAVEIEGNVRRIVAVPITSARQKELLGVDQFYEMDMYVPLADVASIKATDVNGNEIVYKDRFPVTVHVPFLPEPVNEYRHNRVRVKGFFYRLWNYQSEFARQTNQSGQMSPLVIGFEPKILRSSTSLLDSILTIIGISFVIGIFALIWYLRRSDLKSTSPLRKFHSLPDKVDIPLEP